jgi:trans-aconitate 2-methyltransferase
MARDWDAATYDQVSHPHERWGRDVVSWLQLRGDETVLDAGCGSGRVTAQLLERLPRGRVVAVDASPSMLAEAARRLAADRERVEFIRADLRRPLPLAGPVDAVLSTATFHWLPDHGRLYRDLAAVLRPGGQLAAQYGGRGNIASVEAAIRRASDGDWPGPWTFLSAEEARAHLEAAGFVDVDTWLRQEPTRFASTAELETFLETVVLGAHLERLPPAERRPFVRAVAAALPRPELDYVRLNVVARRGPA